MKIFVVIFFISCFGCAFIQTINLNCEFKTGGFYVIGSVNYCNAWNQGDIITDRSNRNIQSLSGSSNANSNLKGIYIYRSNCFYFPFGLVKLAPNLEGIWIENSKLKEIRCDDFKEYKNLRELYLAVNEIQFLEANLFDFIPKIEVILLNSNKISHIDAHIFDSFVGKLSYLFLSGNICQFENASNDKSRANQIISKVQTGVCKNEAILPATTTTSTTITTSTPPPVTSAEFEALMKLIEDLNKKIAADNKKSTDLQMSLLQEFKALGDKVNGQKDELTALKDKLEAEGTCTCNQFENRVKFIEQTIGVDPEHHNNP